MQTPFNSTIFIGAFGPMSKYYGTTFTRATYFSAAIVGGNALGALFMEPFSRVFGRRPVYILSFLLVVVTSVAGAYCSTYGGQVTARFFNGFGLGSAVSIGASTITDLFFQHQRGLVTGVWVYATSSGSFWGSLVGGYIAYYQAWQWVFKAAAIINAATLLGFILTVPETYYDRAPQLYAVPENDFTPFRFLDADRFLVVRRRYKGKVHPITMFTRTFQVGSLPSVLIPAIVPAICVSFTCIATTIIIPSFYAKAYGFNVKAASNINVAGIVGVTLGEAVAGRWSDFIVSMFAKRNNGVRIPEARLHAIWPVFLLVPFGLIIFGTCIYYKVPWIGSCIGFVMAVAGCQIAATVTTTYSIDCYKPLAGYVGTFYTVVRQLVGFAVPFYDVPFGQGAGFAWEFGTYAIVSFVLFLPTAGLIWYGAALRKKFPPPAYDSVD